MSYFLLQNRYIRPLDVIKPSFPAKLVIRIRFGPDDAFGMESDLPRTTAKRGTPAVLTWNANESISFWKGEFIDKLHANFEIGKLIGTWEGNILTIVVHVSNMEDANSVIISANDILPAILSFRLRVFVWIKEFIANINESSFRIETAAYRYGITIASVEQNLRESIDAVRDWLHTGRSGGHSLRLIMAMYYYRHAVRLTTIEPDRQSMTAEIILNLTKAIEVIFSGKRDGIRNKAQEWEIDAEFIEKKIIPLFLIRNQLDVAHVASAPMRSEQLQSLIDFTDRALSHVYDLLSRILKMEQDGRITLDEISLKIDKDKEKLLKDIARYAVE